MAQPARFEVEVLWLTPEAQIVRPVQLAEGATAAQAIAAAGLEAAWQAGEGGTRPLSCYGRLISPETVMRDGDRVEILRPLDADPKDQRQARVQAARKLKRRQTSGIV